MIALPLAINKRLREIALNSAVKQSIIPVFICDENFKICLKSMGAERIFSRPSVNTSVLTHLPKDITERVNMSQTPVSVPFKLPKLEAVTIITKGVIDGEKYYAMIFEPRMMFSFEKTPWYILESYDNLSSAVFELLSSPREDYDRLERSCTQIVRLSEYWAQTTQYEISRGIINTDIYREIDAVVRECAAPLSVIGASVKLTNTSEHTMVCPYPDGVLHIFSSVLLALAVMLSADGHADAILGADNQNGLIAELSISVKYGGEEKITDFHELSQKVQPLRLELAALMDMAEHYGIILKCHTEFGKLILTCGFEGKHSANVRFHAPIHTAKAANIRRIVMGIFGIVMDSYGITSAQMSQPSV